jgi:voltage-gated potassium channel Kch
MKFLMVMNDRDIARFACQFDGVQPFVDLEVLGKSERQGHMSSWKSKQTIEDVTHTREAVPNAHLVVRINPMHENTQSEITEVVARGANSVMLPMFHDRDTLARFLDMLGDKALPLPLFETAASVAQIPQIVPALGIRQLHIGLNDLHLDLGQDFLFQPLAEGYLEEPTQALRSFGIEFGIGGIARTREGIVSPEFLLGEHVRLGSSAVILSQTFHRNATTLEELVQHFDFGIELARLQEIYANFNLMDASELELNRIETKNRINDVVHLIQKRVSR